MNFCITIKKQETINDQKYAQEMLHFMSFDKSVMKKTTDAIKIRH